MKGVKECKFLAPRRLTDCYAELDAGTDQAMPNPDPLTWLGEIDWRGEHRRFGIKRSDRRYHMAIIGRTGMGKSTLMRTVMLSDLKADEGFALIDPHGDLADDIAFI